MHVRRERPADHDAVRAVHRAAFSRRAADRRDEVVEARLTDELREDVGFLPHLSLVGVLPAAQGQGVGSALLLWLLAVAEAVDERVAVLLGAPAYSGGSTSGPPQSWGSPRRTPPGARTSRRGTSPAPRWAGRSATRPRSRASAQRDQPPRVGGSPAARASWARAGS